MPNVSTPPPPGGMTVDFLEGWGDVATVVAVLAVLAVAFLVFAAAGPAVTGRPEWQAWLEGRSSGRRQPASDPDADPDHRSAELGRPSAAGDHDVVPPESAGQGTTSGTMCWDSLGGRT